MFYTFKALGAMREAELLGEAERLRALPPLGNRLRHARSILLQLARRQRTGNAKALKVARG